MMQRTKEFKNKNSSKSRRSVRVVLVVSCCVVLSFLQLNQKRDSREKEDGSFIKTNIKQFKSPEKDASATPLEGLCSTLFSESPNNLWNKLQDEIVRASYWPLRHANNTNFTDWVDSLFQSRFRSFQITKSLGNRPDPHEALRILEIISKRLAFLDRKSRSDDEEEAVSLHILVTGGSVTAGNNCETNPVGLPAADWRRIVSDCPWPIRLQNLFNQVLFDGKSVVSVTNLAAGGSSTEIGKVALEYHLFPSDIKDKMPHVVVWSHAANDAQEHDLESVYYQQFPQYIAAARNLRPCDDDLPLVVLFEDSFDTSFKYGPVNDMTGMIAKVASWFGLMTVSHANVVKHELWRNFNNESVVESIMGTGFNLHYGLGFHISAAWVLLFSFLSVFVESCEGLQSVSKHEEKQGMIILPKKYLAPYKQGGDLESLLNEWTSNRMESQRYCSQHSSLEGICTYSWMVRTV
ncbi:hypothetical protein ACHAWX_001155 [Stephanocyclus meneghinianus]